MERNPAVKWEGQIIGHPVIILVTIFEKLYPQIPIKLVYLSGLESWIPPKDTAKTYSEIPHLLYNEKDYRDQADFYELPMEHRDWTTGALIGLKQSVNGETIILIDWETTPQDAVAVLMELLPRLVSNPNKHVVIGRQLTYRVARRELKLLFEAACSEFQEQSVFNLTNDGGLFSIVHSSMEEFFNDEQNDIDDEGDDDDTMVDV